MQKMTLGINNYFTFWRAGGLKSALLVPSLLLLFDSRVTYCADSKSTPAFSFLFNSDWQTCSAGHFYSSDSAFAHVAGLNLRSAANMRASTHTHHTSAHTHKQRRWLILPPQSGCLADTKLCDTRFLIHARRCLFPRRVMAGSPKKRRKLASL